MLRINLLPKYINDGKKRNYAICFWSGMFVLVIVLVVGKNLLLRQEAQHYASMATELTPKKQQAESLQAQATATDAQSADIRNKADFVSNSIKFDLQTYPTLFSNISTYTLRNVMYDSIIPNGNTVTMSAYARNLADVAHYMMAMERNKEISNVSIEIGSIPAFPFSGRPNNAAGGQGTRPNDGYGHNFNVTLSLITPVPTGPTFGNAAAAPAAGGGMPGVGGMGMSGGMGSRGMMGSGGRGGMMMSGSPGYSGSGMRPGMMPGSGGGPGNPAALGPTKAGGPGNPAALGPNMGGK